MFETNQTDSYISFQASGTTASSTVRIGAVGDDFQAFINGAERLRITSDGNVGIGTNSTPNRLHVYNAGNTTTTIDAVGGDAKLNIRNSGDGNWSGINFIRERSSGTNIVGGGIFMPSVTANDSATLYIQTQSASGGSGITSDLTDNNGVRIKLVGGSGSSSHIAFETNNEALRINAAGNIIVNNDLYIGGTTNYLSSQPSGNYGSVQINGGGKGNWEGYSIDGRAVFMHDGSTTMGLFDDVNNHWAIHHTMGSASVTSIRSGNNANTIVCTGVNHVGIGTATVARGPLHIHEDGAGDNQIHMTNSETGTTSSDGFTIFQGAGSSGEDCGFVNREENGRIRFLMNSGTDMSGNPVIEDQLILKHTGQLGIKTTDPIRTLHCDGEAYFTTRVGIGTTGNSNYVLTVKNAGSPVSTVGGILIDCDNWSTNASKYGILVDIDSTNRTNLTANRTTRGIQSDMRHRVAQNASNTNGTRQSMHGIYASAYIDDTDDNDGKMYQLFGAYLRARVDGVNAADIRGAYCLAQCADNATGGARTVDALRGSYNYAVNDGNQTTITNAYGTYSHVNQDDTGGSMTNAYGVYSRVDRDGGTGSTGYAYRGIFEGTWSTKRGLWITGDTENSVDGSFSKGSGSFKIPHPLPEKNETHHLVHSFVESPQANNIYRGKVALVNGSATINLDTESTMTEGTFVLLNRDIHCFTSNESDWDAVRGSVSGNILTIECQNPSSTATVAWLVIGERHDQHMYDTGWTDENGKVIVEPLQPEPEVEEEKPEIPD